MTYTEYRNTYKIALKAYPEISNTYNEDEDKKEITETITHYIKVGSRWKETESKTAQINCIYYINSVDPRTSRFFRNLGGYERTETAYTRKGFIPIRCTSISPDRTQKTVREYSF